jgi:centrosomal protein CEP76
VDWWRQYQEISPAHAKRQGVRIFAPDESGVSRCVCSYVKPVRAGRMVDSPRHAARFVSLIPFERRAGVGGRRVDTWQSWHTFLSKCRGDVEDHSTLLCSLLLGFGLNAYVVIGTAYDTDGEDETREHSWVAVFPPAPTQSSDVTFIESLTGQRYEVKLRSKASVEALPYHSVSCVFNHESFLALKSTPNTIPNFSFDLSDPATWRSMDPKAIKVAPPAVDEPATLTKKGMGEKVEEELERKLLNIISQKREDAYGLSSNFDEGLAYLLQPAISAYENERLTGFSFGTDDFQSAVKNAVPDKHCFKGLPLCFAHVDPNKIMAGIEGSVIGADILRTRGDKINFALRVKVYEYPENTMAVWIMVSLRGEKEVEGKFGTRSVALLHIHILTLAATLSCSQVAVVFLPDKK